LVLLSFAITLNAATFPVINANNTGAGSMRQAILDANENPAPDTITFQIPGTGVKTITVSSALPPILDPVAIDATTQTGYAGTPLVELSGGGSVNAAGLRILAGHTTVRGLAIMRFLGQGIEIAGPGGTNQVAGNYLGLDADGDTARPNDLQGIWVNNSTGNLIGGTDPADRNVISGNKDTGIYIIGGSSNLVQGNYIGTKANGSVALANGANGISISSSARNQIGGPVAEAGNLISGNGASGIYLKDAGSVDNIVQGNRVGLAANGTTALGNTADGLTINNASRNTALGNVFSGNKQSGVYLMGTATGNNLQGNLIGTDAIGVTAAANTYAGITIARATNNIVGGTDPAARNIIAGNKADGIFMTTNSTANVVAGNWIGLNAAGAVLSNAYNGVTIDCAFGNAIESQNVIAGNAFEGVSLINGASGNVVQANAIGTDPGRTEARANGRAGVGISRSPSNTIGTPGSGNVISGNGDAGIYLIGTTATGNVIQGNRIGTDLTGMLPLGNYREGLYLQQTASNVIGGTLAGAGNVISANGTWGLSLNKANHNILQGNIIGTAIDRSTPLGNATRLGLNDTRFHTIELAAGCAGNTIGGPEPGAGNLVAYTPASSDVFYAAVRIRDGATNNAVLANCFVGNAGLSIDLGGYLETLNDNCDTDNGANHLQNFPVLTEVVAGFGTGVRGTLNAHANTPYRLEFFASPPGAPHSQAVMVLGSAFVTTEPSCEVDFAATFAISVPAGWQITATATDPDNNTSELSAPQESVPAPSLSFTQPEPGTLRVSWPVAGSAGFSLKQTDNLAPPITWTAVTDSVTTQAGQYVLTTSLTGPRQFFALILE